jgi:hypothetical protein
LLTAAPKSFAGALDRDSARRPTDALVSPGISDQPRGLNARAFSGDKTAGDRPGLFQRGSATGAGITGGAANPLSPTIPRERFAGIQGGVLSGVAPPARKRQDSANGTAGEWKRPAKDSPSGGSRAVPDALRQPRQNRASDDDARTRQPASIEGHEVSSGSGVAARPEATGVSLSGRFKRDRAPGEGPIGPPTDGSAGFGNFGTNRKVSQTRLFAWRALLTPRRSANARLSLLAAHVSMATRLLLATTMLRLRLAAAAATRCCSTRRLC